MKSLPTRDRGARRATETKSELSDGGLRESRVLAPSALFAYGTLRRSGPLRTRVFRKLFLASYFQYKRYVEDPFRHLTASHASLFEGGHVLDIGAHVGYTTEVFSAAIGPPFKVFAFEPEPENYRALEARFERSEKVATFPRAVGERDEVAELWINPDDPGDHRVLTPALHERLPGPSRWKRP